MTVYTVKKGDSLYSIAKRYGTSVQALARDNGISNPRMLGIGQAILILEPRQTYTVKRGDNLYSVAQQFGVSINSLLRNNAFLGGRSELSEGQRLTVVPEPVVYDREISANVYVYPSVNTDMLRAVLPYLTYLTIFTYGIETDGELISVDDDALISLAREYGVAPVMLVSSIGEDGRFSSELAKEILDGVDLRNTLIEDIANVLSQKDYVGVNVDFEYVPKEYAQSYAQLINKLRERIEPMGKKVFVTLAPKSQEIPNGEGQDYSALGKAADGAILAAYEFGSSYGEPSAIAPLDKIENALSYTLNNIPKGKLTLGIPDYGYDWKLPYELGKSQARSVGNTEAIRIAEKKGSEILYDEVSDSPHFIYFERNGGKAEEHEVWFENARSIEAVLRLIDGYGLDGISVWNGMRSYMPLWQLVNALYRIRKVLG